MASSNVILRPPTFSAAKPPSNYTSPTIAWLTGTWHVTHSTLPMWKTKRNVRITYTPLEPSDPNIPAENTNRLDDLVEYQSLSGNKVSKIQGVDTASSSASSSSDEEGKRNSWDWRGKGWLKIASSHWEVLGWGEEAETGNKWAVTIFAKTLFTPAGIDVYSQSTKGVSPATLEEIKSALAGIDDGMVRETAGKLFQIATDS